MGALSRAVVVNQRLTISIVATVRNEASVVEAWLDGLVGQSRQPDEIVVVDGGSSDGTSEAIERRARQFSFPIVLVSAPGANISQGRNLAIERATGDVIAVIDAGAVAHERWLECLVEPILNDDVDVSSGFFVPVLDTAWQRALAATTLPIVSEIDPNQFLPSSRSMAFRRAWFDAGVRYPEWLDYCEDLVWDLAMKRAGARFRFVPEASVTFAVRPSPRSFAVQYFRYARGDGKAGLFPRRHGLRYAAYAALFVALRRRRPPELLVTGALATAYVWQPIVRLRTRDLANGTPIHATVAAVPLTVALRGLGDVAKMTGYPIGLAWRWRRFGGLGWRTAWPRVNPAGALFRPAALTRESQRPASSLSGESRAEPR